MDDTFGDSLAVEMCKEINQVEVLKEQRAILTHALRGFGVLYWTAIGGGVDGLLLISEGAGFVVCNHYGLDA